MLVCSVSARARRTIPVELGETAVAADATTGQLVFETRIDEPASAGDIVDVFLGEIIVEAATAVDVIDVVRVDTVLEPASAADDVDASTPALVGSLSEDVITIASQDAEIVVIPSTKIWNPADLVNITLSNGNHTATSQATSGGVRAACSVTTGQKIYWEVTFNTITSTQTAAGCARSTANLGNLAGLGTANAAVVFGNGIININAGFAGSIGTRSSGDVIGIAVDFAAGLIWFRVAPSGNWNGSGTANPATGTGGFSISGITGGPLFPNFSTTNLANEVITGNFGDSTFTGAVPSGFSAGF